MLSGDLVASVESSEKGWFMPTQADRTLLGPSLPGETSQVSWI